VDGHFQNLRNWLVKDLSKKNPAEQKFNEGKKSAFSITERTQPW
jgi:hypothetical protein